MPPSRVMLSEVEALRLIARVTYPLGQTQTLLDYSQVWKTKIGL